MGFDFHPSTQMLWFSDNGRDMMGDDIPPDELNRITKEEEHFGFPYVHGGVIVDPEFGEGKILLITLNLHWHWGACCAIGYSFLYRQTVPK